MFYNGRRMYRDEEICMKVDRRKFKNETFSEYAGFGILL